jgi:glutamate synthase domain-containing protein 1
MDRYYVDLSDEGFRERIWRWFTSGTARTRCRRGRWRSRSGSSAHNGEINTLRGNINMMRSRERTLKARCSATTSSKLPPC